MSTACAEYLCTVRYSSVIRRGVLPFVATWLDTEDITLSEVSQKEKRQIPQDFTPMWTLKQKQTYRFREPISSYQKDREL